MTAHARRVQLAPGYILHHYPYRDTSRILEVLTRDAGRLSIFARGVRGPKAKLASELQPFRLLLLSWSGKGEAPMLSGAEGAPDQGTMPPACLMAGFYLNELLLKLTHRHDPVTGVFDTYHATLEGLKHGAALEPSLRIFEKRLLDLLGYGVELDVDASTAASICLGSGSMKSATRIPETTRIDTASFRRCTWLAASSPPSVVISWRFSGTRQQSGGRT